MLPSAIYSEGFLGHEAEVEKLALLASERRLPHALLFSGPSGIGKARVARWTAAASLCEAGGCGACPACRKVLSATHPDCFEVKPESGRQEILIQQIRDLQNAVGIKSFEGAGKAALIDEADRMNEEAQNAFLKTLEEPPPATVILLVSSLPDRLLPTIRSRCQRFRFHPLEEGALEAFAAGREGLNADFPLALAQGSPGRLLVLVQADAGRARRILQEFLCAGKAPSPVKTCADLAAWSQSGEGGNLRPVRRERLRLALELLAGLVRDLAALKAGAGSDVLLNRDMEMELRGATRYYGRAGLFAADRWIAEASADIMGYVDQGLAVERVFRSIREIREI